MKRTTKSKSFFNLVEVALAIAVMGIGVAGIMALFPVGMNSSRDAIAENYAADSADFFISYIERECKESDASWQNYIQRLYSNGGFYSMSDSTPAPDFFTASVESGISTTPIADINSDGIKVYNHTTNSSLYRVTQGAGTCTDYDAIIRIWKTAVVSTLYSGDWTSYSDTDYGTSAGLNVEMSWPAGAPYSQRSKRCFYKEVFKAVE